MRSILVRSNVAFVLGVALLALAGCERTDPEWHPIVPGGEGTFVVVFRQGVSQQEISAFDQENLIVGDLEEGHSLRPGIRGMRLASVDGHRAYVVDLDPSLTPEKRAVLRDQMVASPKVLDVFEDVLPDEITLGSDRGTESVAPLADIEEESVGDDAKSDSEIKNPKSGSSSKTDEAR